MRIHIQHRTSYTYDQPAKSIIQILRLTPRNHEGQFVRDWHVELDHDAALRIGEDAFGNVTHTLSLAGPVSSLNIALEGEVETADTNGVIRETIERFPVRLYLRETPLTAPDKAIQDYAINVTRGIDGSLSKLHALLASIQSDIAFDTGPTDAATTATQAFTLKRGVCQDLTHIFIASARQLGIPARYVGGHLHRADGAVQQEAGHAWSEAYIDELGWVGFDPTNGICVTDAYVRVSAGLDYLGAAPVRGTRFGGVAERMTVDVHVRQSAVQVQE